MGLLSNEEIQFVLAVFDAVDVDCSGTIDKSELKNAMTKLGEEEGYTAPEPTEEQVEETLKILDTNDDGVVDKKEFLQFVAMNKVLVICAVLFDEFDEDKSNSIDSKELGTILTKLYEGEDLEPPTEDQLNEYMQELDQDGNGVIDFAEFCAFMIPIVIEASEDCEEGEGEGEE
eukprot:CAMPEP_0185727060 /NCGR_PEP_ID=MMETSP1171-20130828/2848_1 /TAXON_ID=374046 /ORGANISM="Helicotheca tamensis, Strain CCMP826" /LENGTH=173 /DNA_ID=CAMNT_0028395555 /DNA_START=83 /DNA_END=604 /DNA_ORIENTATION=-